MANPWTKKNPFMSMWLSGANAIAGRLGGHAKVEAVKQLTTLTNRAKRVWTNAWLTAIKPKRRR
jgi:truncated hemoglobin YjbI